MEEIRILGENHRHAYKSLMHFITYMLYRVYLAMSWIITTTLVVTGTDCTGSCILPCDHDHDGPLCPWFLMVITMLNHLLSREMFNIIIEDEYHLNHMCKHSVKLE